MPTWGVCPVQQLRCSGPATSCFTTFSTVHCRLHNTLIYTAAALAMVLTAMAHRRLTLGWKSAEPSLHGCQKRFAFFDDIGGELRPVGAADVLRRMGRSGRDEQHIAGLDRHRLAANLVLERAFDNVDNLFARMRMHRGDISGIEIDAHLDDLASGCAEIVALQVGAFGSRLLC